jgi:hypothetical protein
MEKITKISKAPKAPKPGVIIHREQGVFPPLKPSLSGFED